MTQPNEDLEAIYGPAAPFSEHKRGDHITYTTAEGLPGAGVIVCSQAPVGEIGLRYVVAPDVPTGFVDFVWPGDVIASHPETCSVCNGPATLSCDVCEEYYCETCFKEKHKPGEEPSLKR